MLVKFVSSVDGSCFYAQEGTIQYDVLKSSEEYTREAVKEDGKNKAEKK